MIRVRRHTRQLASGRTVTVRQHHREVTVTTAEDTAWWDHAGEEPVQGSPDDPEGTTYFRQGDGVLCAVHPDGTVHEVGEAAPDDGPEPIRARCSTCGEGDGRLDDGRECPHCHGYGEVLLPSRADDEQDAGDTEPDPEMPGPADWGWAEDVSRRPSYMGSPWAGPAPDAGAARLPVAWKDADRAERARRVADLREARAELERISKRDREETEDFLAANNRVIEAEKHVSPWRRWWTGAGEGS